MTNIKRKNFKISKKLAVTQKFYINKKQKTNNFRKKNFYFWKTPQEKRKFYELKDLKLKQSRNLAWKGKNWQKYKNWTSLENSRKVVWYSPKLNWNPSAFMYKNNSIYKRESKFSGYRGVKRYCVFLKRGGRNKNKQIINYLSTTKSWKLYYFAHLHLYRRTKFRYLSLLRLSKGVQIPEKWEKQNKYKSFSKFNRWASLSYKWQIPLMFPNRLYGGRTFVWYLRHKHLSRKKKNRPYSWFNRTVHNRWRRGFRKKSFFRIRQLFFGKLILPFYGRLRKKQFLKIKSRAIKSRPTSLTNSRSSNFFGKLEKRFDVLCFRLNIAPTIYWIRIFIKMQLIYVGNFSIYNFFQLAKKSFFEKFPIDIDREKKLYLNFFFMNNNKKKYFSNFPEFWKNKKEYFKTMASSFHKPTIQPQILIPIKSIIYFSVKHIKCLFLQKVYEKKIPNYFLYQKLGMSFFAYFYKQPKQISISKFDRIKPNYLNWVSL